MKYEAAVQNHRKRALDSYISTNAALVIATEGRQLFSVSNNSDRPTDRPTGNHFWDRPGRVKVQTRFRCNSPKTISIDQTGINTNPKGGNRLWRTRFAWFREIDFSHEGTPPPTRLALLGEGESSVKVSPR